ncbi:MAG TPA: L-threonylcarbamoyladenylate synthase [Cytophagaceae bacterium]|jgi:L-threonylcarbamoyladenylate synthase
MQEQINKTVEALKAGKVILYPTDTIWGIGCDPTNKAAVNKTLAIKKRSKEKGMITLIGDINQLIQYVDKIPDVAWDIVEFSEKPLTVVYPKGKSVDESILNSDGSIAVRLVKEEFCQKLIRKFGKAIASTSANISGDKSPGSFSDISQEIIESVDYVVELFQDRKEKQQESTIIKLDLDGTIKFLRK